MSRTVGRPLFGPTDPQRRIVPEPYANLATAKIAGALFNKAINGNVTCMIFWPETRAGWTARQINESNDDADIAELGARIARLCRSAIDETPETTTLLRHHEPA